MEFTTLKLIVYLFVSLQLQQAWTKLGLFIRQGSVFRNVRENNKCWTSLLTPLYLFAVAFEIKPGGKLQTSSTPMLIYYRLKQTFECSCAIILASKVQMTTWKKKREFILHE